MKLHLWLLAVLLMLQPAEATWFYNVSTTAYVPAAVDFNGTTTWLERDADYTGNADSKSGTVSIWVKFDAVGATQYLIEGAQSRTTIWVSGGGVLRIELKDSANVMLVQFDQNTANFSAMTAGNWYHILASWDKSVETRRHLYINNTECLTATTFLSDNVDVNTASIDYTQTDHSIGSYDGGLFFVNGCLSEVYYAPGQYIDLSNSANRLLFRSAGGSPISLGATGNTPTGTAPLVYLKGDFSAFNVNSGTGGNLVKKGVGAFTACSNFP